MTVQVSDFRTEIMQRLGDSNEQIWDESEIDRYIQDGYDLMTRLTGCLFGVALSPDYAFAFNITADWEADYAEAVSGYYANGPANFTCIDERDFLNNAKGPANINYPWEYNKGYQTQAGSITEISPLVDLPDDLQDIERATWNTKRCTPLVTREMEGSDQRFELNKGIVEGYFRDKDGINILRKWRVPSSAYPVYSFDDETDLQAFTTTQSFESIYLPTGAAANGPCAFTCGDDFKFSISGDQGPATHNYLWEQQFGYTFTSSPANEDGLGILRDLSTISTAVVEETADGAGELIQIDGVNVFEDFGILGPIYQENLNLRIEYSRRGLTLSDEQPFEIPDRYTVYVRHYVLARALEREGPGQHLKLSAHFQSRWTAGIERMKKRKNAMSYERANVLGGRSSIRGQKPPRVKFPWPYGQVVR